MISQEQFEHVLANSFQDFHVRGFDYVCLARIPEMVTLKFYFFEGDVAASPEVVIPHDHRYDFETTCLAGMVTNYRYELGQEGRGELYERFDYLTPLNVGDGFTWRDTVRLHELGGVSYERGGRYTQAAADIHTIRVRPDTVLRLVQYEDVVPVGVPTSSYRLAGLREPPSLDGLYARMSPDRLLTRLSQLEALGEL